MASNILFKKESYEIIGACIEVYNNLPRGLKEVVYQDALEIEFKDKNIPYEREKAYQVMYKGIILEHSFRVDFLVFDEIIVELKALPEITGDHVSQVINYLIIAEKKLSLILNFGSGSLEHKRVVNTLRI